MLLQNNELSADCDTSVISLWPYTYTVSVYPIVPFKT